MTTPYFQTPQANNPALPTPSKDGIRVAVIGIQGPSSGLTIDDGGVSTATPWSSSQTSTAIALAIQKSATKLPVRVATVGEMTSFTGLQTIDGVTLLTNDRVLVKDEAGLNLVNNGIYLAKAGAWVRASDADTGEKLYAGCTVFVNEGDVNAGNGYVLYANGPITPWSTPISFNAFTDVGYVRKATGVVGDGAASSFLILHNLNTVDIFVTVRKTASPHAILSPSQYSVSAINVNQASVVFNSAPEADEYTIVVMG